MTVQQTFQQNTSGLRSTLHQRPVECILLLILTLCNSILRNLFDGMLEQAVWLVIPIMLPLSFIGNVLLPQGNKWRRLYEMILPITIIVLCLSMDPKLLAMRETTQYNSLFAMLIISCLMVKNFNNDIDFIINMASLGWAILKGILIAFFAWVAVSVVVMSVENIFDFNTNLNLLSIPWTLIFPITALSLYDRTPLIDSIKSPIANGVLNYVATTAIIIYTIILYIYIAKMFITWELPTGGVARVTYIYFLVAISTCSLYRLAMVNIFNSFYHWLPVIAVPIICLFWVSIIRRIYDYGFTEQRVYVLMLGILNIVFMFMVFFDRKKAYKSTLMHALCFIAVLAFIPPLSAANIASHLQWTNATPSVVLSDDESESPIISGYKFFENDNMPTNIDGFKKAVFPSASIKDGLLELTDDGRIVFAYSIEDVLRKIAHRNNMTYDELLEATSETGCYQTSLILETNSMCIVFKKIVLNEYENDVAVSVVFMK